MFFQALKTFFDTFGAVIFVPVVIFIIALFLKVKPKKAFMSALSAGVGLQGFNLVIGAYSPIVTPIINRMVSDTGVNLPIIDFGWQATSVIAYSTEIGMIFIGVAILIQVLLFLTRFTNVFQAGDLWNNYSYMAWGSMLFILTGNIWLSLCFMVFLLLVTLLTTEIIQKRWSTYYQYPACTIASLHTSTVTLLAVPINQILDIFGLYKIKSDPEAFRKKLGFVGEPMTLGLFLGLLIGIIGNFSRIGTLPAWGEIATCAIATAAVMAVFPKISSIFAGSFSAITEASKKSVKGTKGEWYLAVNDATGYGEPATLITGIVLMPLTMAVAFVLPGNQTLPMLDLVAIPYLIQPIIAVSNGNIVKSIISGLIIMAINLYFCTMTGATFTQVAALRGVDLAGAAMITSFGILGQPIPALFFLIFNTKNPLLIALAVIAYAIGYVLVRKNKPAIHEFLEKAAVKSGISEAA
jgi:PTS system galactitol-specific IIC component